ECLTPHQVLKQQPGNPTAPTSLLFALHSVGLNLIVIHRWNSSSFAWRFRIQKFVDGPTVSTAGYVKLLLPPRQSRGNSHWGLDVIPGGAASPDDPGGPADPTDPWAPQFGTISVVAPGLIERIKVGPFSSGRNQRSFSKTPLALL